MSYRRESNSAKIWKDYCDKNIILIESLAFPEWVFKNESNFREFATYGKLSSSNEREFDFYTLESELFWKLFDFISDYFDMDAALFDKIEQRRINSFPKS